LRRFFYRNAELYSQNKFFSLKNILKITPKNRCLKRVDLLFKRFWKMGKREGTHSRFFAVFIGCDLYGHCGGEIVEQNVSDPVFAKAEVFYREGDRFFLFCHRLAFEVDSRFFNLDLPLFLESREGAFKIFFAHAKHLLDQLGCAFVVVGENPFVGM